jgi:hypothetical protein
MAYCTKIVFLCRMSNVQGPCAQLRETLTVVLYRLNVIIDRLKLLLVQVML